MGEHKSMGGRSLLVTYMSGTFHPFTSFLAAGPHTAVHFPVLSQYEATADMVEADLKILLLVICGWDMWLPKSQQRNQICWQRAGFLHLLLLDPWLPLKQTPH